MHLANVMGLALADVNDQLRREFPELFRLVDAIKAQPGWHPHQQHQDAPQPPQTIHECAWCGEFFAPSKPGRRQLCCSHSCRGEYQTWNRRRNAA